MRDNKQSGWLRLFCPEGQCLREEERIDLPKSEKQEEGDLWLKTFCPEQQCEIDSASMLP